MLVHPRDLRLLAVKSMSVPENNEMLHDSLLEILPLYKNFDGVIMDRACGFLPTAQADKNLKQTQIKLLEHRRLSCERSHERMSMQPPP